MALEPFETAESHDDHTVQQLSVFLDNRVGQLLQLTRLLEQTDVHILAISVVNSVDCAVIRMIVDQPDEAVDLFRQHRFGVSQSELIVVSLPHGKRALLRIWAALMAAEVNITYTYPLIVMPHDAPAMAIQLDNIEMGLDVLMAKNFDVISQSDLISPGY